MDNKCPKCGEKISIFYLKQNCPHCGVNLLYYKMDEQLEADALKAKQEVEALWNFVRKIDKARLVEKYYKKQNKPLPWEELEQEIEEAEEKLAQEETETV